MTIIIFVSTLIICGTVYFIYNNFISFLLEKLDLKLENYFLHTNFTVLNKNFELIFVYNMVKFILFFLSLFLFFSCTWMFIGYTFKLNSSQLLRTFIIVFIPYLCILYVLFKICLDVFNKKKVSFHEIGMVVLLSYSTIFLALVVEELGHVPFANLL